MLLVQLRSSNRPLNCGELQPRLSKPPGNGRCSSLGATPRDTGHGLQPARPRSVGARHAGMSFSSCGKARGRDVEPSPKLVQEHKQYSNRNSYRGSMLEGRKHGAGLYTWSDGSEYSGEFHDGYMWGHGERHWPNGRKYRGEWVRDMMWGAGEMVWPSGEVYTGQFRKGIFHGEGARVWPSGDRYTGEFRGGEQEGEGTFENAVEGWVYRGHWFHGCMCGDGRAEWPNGIVYTGEWKDGIREGTGRLSWPDGSLYEGQFRNNCIEGYGRKSLSEGTFFEGHFHNGELEGHGVYHWADGTEFEGLWHISEVVGPGCHRFPDDTTITGVFEHRGASGEGTKRWANGCHYAGQLLRNQIHHHGILKYPDGRTYAGSFQEQAMHGDGALSWVANGMLCKYTGRFERNQFHGAGRLEWASQASYVGEFSNGLYHGEGKFEWANRLNVYIGQWEHGDMCGKGMLTSGGDCAGTGGDAFVYVGDFQDGHLDGQGKVTFVTQGGSSSSESYSGQFRRSMFDGTGTYSWAKGHSLSGVFEQGQCNRVGCKRYPGGKVYYGELRSDLEHGKGIMVDGGKRLVGLWTSGRIDKELVETAMSSLEVEDQVDETVQHVFGGFRDSQADSTGIPQTLDDGADGGVRKGVAMVSEGKGIVLYVNGDKYVGQLKAGRRHGLGMYVYSDLVAFKGHWVEDSLDGVRHPVALENRSDQAVKLCELNEDSMRLMQSLRSVAGMIMPGDEKRALQDDAPDCAPLLNASEDGSPT